LGAAFDFDLKSEQMGGVHSKGQSNDAASQNAKEYTSS
jgi:predicted RNase H-like HicB family nuclease